MAASKKRTSRKKKRISRKKNSAIKIYFGIFLCLFLIILVVVFSINKPKQQIKPIDNNQTIQKIEQYLTKSKKSILDEKAEHNTTMRKQNDILSILKQDLNTTNDKNISLTNIQNTSLKVQNQQINNNSHEANKTTEQKNKIPHDNSNKQIYKNNHDIYTSKTKKSIKVNRPKLAIIIDDIATNSHLNALKSLNMKITPSILPPTNKNPKSAELANKFDFFMVHLPLSAFNFKGAEQNTLDTYSTNTQIHERIKTIKREFPKLKYINNHTGSKFTSNFNSTKLLLENLKKYDILFVDSLTTNHSEVKNASKLLGLKYVYRDIFLDNQQNVSNILTQLQKAVIIAKRDGYAIAIGHPHTSTIQALRIAKNTFLKEVELVYLKDIYGFYE